MPTAEIMRTIQERRELWKDGPVLRAVVVRHGEPLDRFNENTRLSPLGVRQFEGFIGSYLAQLDERSPSGRPLIILIGDTGIARTKECGVLTHIRVGMYILERQVQDWVSVVYRGSNTALRPKGIVKTLKELGIPQERVFEEYFNASDIINKERGIRFPREVASDLEEELEKILRTWSAIYQDHDIDYIVPNHEVGIGSLIKSRGLDKNWQVGFAEAVTITFKANKEREYSFRQQKSIKGQPLITGNMNHLILASPQSPLI